MLFAVASIAQPFITDHYNDLAGLDNDFLEMYNNLTYGNIIIDRYFVCISFFA